MDIYMHASTAALLDNLEELQQLTAQVFADNGITLLKPEVNFRGEVESAKPFGKEYALSAQNKDDLCNGEDCGWGYPLNTGYGHVIVPNYKQKVMVDPPEAEKP
eukprot:1159170-Pelagomonas_calceolata.AAC.2